MGLEFLGGIANAYKGYQQGADAELARQQLELDKKQREEDRTYQRSQREYNAGQQARTVRDQTREDGVQDSLRAITTEREIEVNPDRATTLPMVDDSGEPSAAQLPAPKKVARYGDEIARDYARVLTKDGKFGEAEKYMTYANKTAFERATNQFNQAVSASAGKSGLEIAEAVADVFKNDPYAGQIENIQAGPNGSITLDAVNKETGLRQTKTFASAEQVVNDLRGYFTPETQQKLEEARRLHAEKTEQERAKALNEREKFMWQEGIKAGFRGAPGGRAGGTGGSATPGKPEKTGKEIALATVEDKFKNELDPSALTRVRNFVSTSYDLDPSIDNLQRVMAAEEAATSPASVSPRLMFGSQAGIAATHVNASTGAKTPLHKVSPQYIPTEDDLKGFKADVAAYIDGENKRQPGFGSVLLAAAQGSQTAVAEATSMLAGKIAQDLIARKPFPPGMPVAEKQKALAALQERSMALAKQNMPLVQNSISMIKAYGLK